MADDAVVARPARGLAIFSCAQAGVLEAVGLPSRVKPLAVLDTAPWLEPLVDMISFGDRAVAVLGRETAVNSAWTTGSMVDRSSFATVW